MHHTDDPSPGDLACSGQGSGSHSDPCADQPLWLMTERLLLRSFAGADLPALAAMLADPRVMQYSVRGLMSRAASAEFLQHCRAALAEDGFAPLAVVERSSQRLAGFCGLSLETFENIPEAMLGYRLAPAFWGQGLATEATLAILAHGFEQLGLASIMAVVQPENRASVQVLHKAGFSGYLNARYHGMNVRIYRMRREQWPVVVRSGMPGLEAT